METQEDIVGPLRNSLTNIKHKVGELEKKLENVSLNKNIEKNDILEVTKQLIEDLYHKLSETRNIFNNSFDKIGKNKSNSKKTLIEASSSEYEDASENNNISDQNDIAQLLTDDEDVNSEVINDLHNYNVTNSNDDKELNSKDDNSAQNVNNSDIHQKLNEKNTFPKKSKKVANVEEGSVHQSNGQSEDKIEKNNSSNYDLDKSDESIVIGDINQVNNRNDSCKETVNLEKQVDEVMSGSETLQDNELVDQEKENDVNGETENHNNKDPEIVESSKEVETKEASGEECNSEDIEENTATSINCDTEMSEVENVENSMNSSDLIEINNDSLNVGDEQIPDVSNKEDSSKSNDTETSGNQIREENNVEIENESHNNDLAVNSPDASNDISTEPQSEIIKEESYDENTDNPQRRPMIRLVSIDKLMEKPKKTVTFDASIIILSSDEEGSPRKVVESSEKFPHLKSALKNTSTKTNSEKSIKKVDEENNSDDEDQLSSRKSSRLKDKVEKKEERRSRLKSIFVRTKRNEWKGKKTHKSDGDVSSKKKKAVLDLSDSSDDDNSNVRKKRISENNRKLVIRLPIVDCEKLKKTYLKNNDFFSAKSLAKMNSKRGRKEDSQNSSDSDSLQSKTKRKKAEPGSTADTPNPSTQKDGVPEVDDGVEGKERATAEKTKQTEAKNDDSENSGDEATPDEKMDTVEIESSDSDDDFTKKIKAANEKKKKKKVISDSEDDGKENKVEISSDESSKSSDNKDDSDKESDSNKNSKRRRIQRTNDSSDSEGEVSTRKQIRKLIDRDSLSETTKKAEAEEKERKARIAEKQKKYNAIMGEAKDASVEKVILEIDEKTEKELLSVDTKLAKKLKPHQASGIRFMWDACFESLDRAKKTSGSGCILAHCMGLGKTLQVIALSHTLLDNSEKTGVNKILVVCPVNTVLNWKAEFKKWLPRKTSYEIYELVSCKQIRERKYKVAEWHEEGGVLIIGYTMFRNISNPDNKKVQKSVRKVFLEGLVDPGPDLVICDEGHLLKNEKTNLSIAMNRIKTNRRIVLTGTPLQNNLKEYWCMVQFIKPNLLGTYKEYLNRFVNPITNGQYTDSTQHDILLMRKRSHVLHKLLDGVVQRRDYSVLAPYLPPKHEFILFVRLSDVQVKLCQHYMDNYAQRKNSSSKVSFIFADFQQLQMICTHPRVLLNRSEERKEKIMDDEEESEGSLKDFIDDGEVSSKGSSSSSSSDSDSDTDSSQKSKKKNKQQKTRVTRAQAAQRREDGEESEPEIMDLGRKEWWQDICSGDELEKIDNSGKMSLLFHLLRECEEIGDKILIFSQSLYTLNCIEYFLEKIDEATRNGETEKYGGYSGTWDIGLDYFRLDGSSSCDNRAAWCDMFNSPDNTRARLFLISTKAGGLGINLVAANRVIIFDVSWNPSHDIQSIYRVYRFGQTKPSYIYRFVTYGAMEMKIYERQVTKQAISKRVIDEQQIDRHYNQTDLQELYKCEFIPKEDRPIPLVPKDVLLGEMLMKYDKVIYKYHEHQSLLENKEEECLNEEERKAAWDEFENEKILRKNTSNVGLGMPGMGMGLGINAPLIAIALANIVRRDNPTWSEVQINGIIPALVQQLKVQLSENDTSMYARVQQEIQRMQIEAREAEFQRQMMQMYAQSHYMQIARQQQLQNSAGNMQMKPTAMRQIYNNIYPRGPNPAASGSGNRPAPPNDVIELID